MANRNRKKKRPTNRPGGSVSPQRPEREDRDGSRGPALRGSTETQDARRTTELAAYVALVLAVVIAALAVDADGRGGEDPFGAQEALRYITVLTVGYMLARGAAKAGSHRRGPGRRSRATDHLADEQGVSQPLDGAEEHDRHEAHVETDEPAASGGHSSSGTTDATALDEGSFLLPAPDGHTHQDGHAHEPGHPHDDGHVHGRVVSHRG